MTKTIDPHPILPEATRDLADETATAALARSLACCARAGDVIALSGNLGTGKTSFARAFVRAFHEREDEEVPSPTFTLVEIYDTPRGAFWHFDLYRLEAPEQVFELGWEEARADGVVLVEWAERLGPLLPADRLDVALAVEGDGRRVTLQGDARFGDF